MTSPFPFIDNVRPCMTMRSYLAATVAALSLGLALPAIAQEQSYQGQTLFGDPMYTTLGSNPVNAAPTDALERAIREAKAAYEAEPSIDNTTWYGRVLGYNGLMKEAVEVYTAGLRRHAESAKLYRHRAHRYFSLREFDKSIEDGLKSAELYESRPLERERLGPEYFPSTPDVVQFYTYYHLGQAYFAKHDFANAAKWFEAARQVGIGVDGAPDETAATYWLYLSLARGGRYEEGRELLADFDITLLDLVDNRESNYYFDGIQLFKNLRDPADVYSEVDGGKAFSTADGIKASTAYSLANYYLLIGDREKARENLARALNTDTWSYFARIQAEADWIHVFGRERPQT